MRQRSKSVFVSFTPDESILHENITSNSLSYGESSPSWSKDDVKEFLEKIRFSIPDNDKLSYQTRRDRIDWSKIAFKDHNAKECKLYFDQLVKGIRRFRYFEEILNDIETKNISDAAKQPKDTKAITPWTVFLDDVREEIKNENPDKSKAALLTIARDKYKLLNNEEKNNYKNQANLLNGKKSNNFVGVDNTKPNTKSGKSGNMTGYLVFFKEHNSEIMDIPPKQKVSLIAQKWREMDEELKITFKDKAKIMNEEFVKNNEVSKPQKTSKKIKKRSGYTIFITELMKSDEMKDVSQKEKFTEVSKRWKLLDEDIKNSYLKKAKEFNKQKLLDENVLIKIEPDSPKKEKKSKKRSKKELNNDENDSFVNINDTNNDDDYCDESVSKKQKKMSDDANEYNEDYYEEDYYGDSNNQSYVNDDEQFEESNIQNNDYNNGNDDSEEDIFETSNSKKKVTSSKKKEKEKKKIFVARPDTPPGSLFDYYKIKMYSGNPLKVERAYAKLNETKRKELIDNYKDITDNYLIQLKQYLENLSKKEITEFYKRRKNIQ